MRRMKKVNIVTESIHILSYAESYYNHKDESIFTFFGVFTLVHITKDYWENEICFAI